MVNSNIYLYNTFTDHAMALSAEVDELINRYKNDVNVIKNIHPTLFENLIRGGFFIEKNIEEWEEVFSQWEKEDCSPQKFTMIINPTLDCNMRCWYCYEQHNKMAYMSDKILQSIKNLIERQTSNSELKGLNIDFFGGEPLLCYKKQVQPILEKAYNDCLRFKKKLYVSFTTNGFLLTPKIIGELNKYAKWGQIRIQITLDGNEKLHNKVKCLGGIHPTYKKIVSNIQACVQQNIKVLVRLNYTNENIDSFYDIIEEFEVLSPTDRRNISFAMHKVWQETNNVDLEEREIKLREAFQNANFTVDIPEPLSKIRCYADRENFIVINYNGDLYKCTAREFLPNSREGVLAENGEIIWNDRFKKRMILKKCPPICHKCILFPLCHAGCTQYKMETLLKDDECPHKYTEMQKKRLLEKKIEHRIKYLQDEV